MRRHFFRRAVYYDYRLSDAAESVRAARAGADAVNYGVSWRTAGIFPGDGKYVPKRGLSGTRAAGQRVCQRAGSLFSCFARRPHWQGTCE